MKPVFDRSAWWRHDRFGMFIHWGAYAVAGRGEWVRSNERLSVADYQPYVDAFQPTEFDADAWAELAVQAGMKYAVLTAKHHDGFCLFDSALTTYSTMHNGLGRDLVREFLEAFRARGIKVGLYYSLLDWAHPDYPAFGDEAHPLRDDRNAGRGEHFDRYLDYLHGQVRELTENYGPLDLMWFDYSYGDLTGERWRAAELIEMVRARHPEILIDNRLEASGGEHGSILTGSPTPWAGDFVSPEQTIPPAAMRGIDGDPVPWEACITLNNHWGYCPDDRAFKSGRMVIRALVEVVSKGGNLLLNVGPGPDGRIGDDEQRVLREVGDWLARNGSSISGAGPADLPKPDWGRYTQQGDTVFAHVLEPPIGPLALTGIDAARVVSLEVDGVTVERVTGWAARPYPGTVLVSFGPAGGDESYTYPLPDDADTVVTVRLASALRERALRQVAEPEAGSRALGPTAP